VAAVFFGLHNRSLTDAIGSFIGLMQVRTFSRHRYEKKQVKRAIR
jgi:hypothetical protein